MINHFLNSLFFKTSFCNWEILDKYGGELEKEIIRDIRLDEILSNTFNLRFNYFASLKSIKSHIFDSFGCLYEPDKKNLRIYPLYGNANHPNVSFKCKDLNEAEYYLNMICKNEDLKIVPRNEIR